MDTTMPAAADEELRKLHLDLAFKHCLILQRGTETCERVHAFAMDVRQPWIERLAAMEDQLAEHRAWIAQLQTERAELAQTVLDLQDALRKTVCGLTAESALQSDDVPLEEADPQHSLMHGHVTPRLYVPTDTVMDDIGSPT
jgi:hypothetical protein